MLSLFASAFLLGLLFNVAPGAIFVESLRRGLRGGFAPAFAVQIGSLTGDFIWAVLGLAGAAALFTVPAVHTPLAVAGACMLLVMAVHAAREGLGPMPVPDPVRGSTNSALMLGAALSLSNPLNITYWAALGGTITALGADRPGPAAFAVFLAGFMASSVLWCFVCAGLIAGARRFVGPVLWMVLNLGCALGLAAFAAVILVRIAH